MDNSLSRIAANDNDSGSKTLKKLVIKGYDPDDQHKIQHKPHPPTIPNYISKRNRTAVHPLSESHSSSDNDQDDNLDRGRNTTTKKNTRSRKTHNSPSHSRIKNTRIVPTNPIPIGGQQPTIQSPYRSGSLHSLDSNSSLNNHWSVYQGSVPTSTPQQSNKTESRIQTSGRLSKIGLGVDRQQSFSKSETDLRPRTLPPIQSSNINDSSINAGDSFQRGQYRTDSFDHSLNRQYHSDQNLKRIGDTKAKLSSMSLDDHNISKLTKFNQSTVMLPIYTNHIRNGTHETQQNEFELERYFPDRQVSLFVGTWNMHGEKVSFSILVIFSK